MNLRLGGSYSRGCVARRECQFIEAIGDQGADDGLGAGSLVRVFCAGASALSMPTPSIGT